jgi:hypothetical protein
MIYTYTEIRKILKNDFVILAGGGSGRTERRKRPGLRGGGGRAVRESSIIGTGREGRRRTCAPGGLAAIWDDGDVNGRGERGGRETDRLEGVSPGKPFLVGFGCRTVAAM